jgi:hypothetical protein
MISAEIRLTQLPLNFMANPWALCNFLSYGALSIGVRDAAELQEELQLANQDLAEDGWHVFAGPLILKYLNNGEDHTLVHELEFLVLHKFTFASFLLADSNHIFIRIYLIPFDLPGVQGRLRVRRDAIVGPARRCLAGLLPKICRNRECWDGRSVPDPPLDLPVRIFFFKSVTAAIQVIHRAQLYPVYTNTSQRHNASLLRLRRR